MTAPQSRTDPEPVSIAVVIPAHNSAATRDAALGSVAGQTLRPTEEDVVDDGSSDATADAAKSW